MSALFGFNEFASTCSTHVTPGNKNQPFCVKTKLIWNLTGEFEHCISTINQQPASQQKKTIIFHVSKNRTKEPELGKIVQLFWNIEADGIQRETEQVHIRQEKFHQSQW